jgi:hypothetical protein
VTSALATKYRRKFVNHINPWLLSATLLVCSSAALANWHPLTSHASAEKIEIDMDSIKQSGPMAIYRQVQVRSQVAHAKDKDGETLTTQLYEYDCMGSKMRILDKPEPQWQELPEHPLGQETLQLICPSG